MKHKSSFFLGILACCCLGQDLQLKPLENALWKGTLNISIQGDLQNHFLANKMTEMGTPVGFTQEKAKMNVDFTLVIQFLINPLGETTLVAEEHFSGTMERNLEIMYRTEEDRVMEGGITVPDHVQMRESKESTIDFGRDAQYDQDSFTMGKFSIRPSGRMGKKGAFEIHADLDFVYSGEGSYVFEKERQPPSEEYARLQEKANLTQVFHLPVKFSARIEHRGKPVEGALVMLNEIENPFTHEDMAGHKKDLFTNKLNLSGTYSLEPINMP